MPSTKPGQKGKKAAPTSEPNGAATSSKKGKAGKTDPPNPPEATEQEKPKKPDTRTLIAGASWTGKLPMTLFNEHVQRQPTWEKPEYTTHRTPNGGFTGAVILRQKNPKTNEITTLPPIMPPREYVQEKGTQPTAVEARHFAAAYALFRVCNGKNLAMALPPQYRDLWKGDFAALKAEAVAQGHGYLYEADPFLAARQREEAKIAKEKERVEKEKKRELEMKNAKITMDGQVQRLDRGWEKAPKAEMGVKTRREVERLVRAQGLWNLYGVTLSDAERKEAVQKLSSYGFRPSHAEEALVVCGSLEEAIEWLLIHLPEDDVPAWALPENYLAGLALASGDMQREGRIKRLAAAGYTRDVCEDALTACNGDEDKAAFLLQRRLLGESLQDAQGASLDSSDGSVWEEEQATLEAIYGDRYSKNGNSCAVTLELRTPSGASITVLARPPDNYPQALPALSVETALPAYVRLSILRQVLLFAKESLMGEMMLFNILDWLESNIPRIIENPGKLGSIVAATSVVVQPRESRRARRPHAHPKAIRWIPDTPLSQRVKAEFLARQSTLQQQKMRQLRQSLPAWNLRDKVVASVAVNQVTIISGETGSGKSTQCVQFLLDDLIQQGYGEQANIICTQPRRISALGLADRVAEERCIAVGSEVGYIIRGEAQRSAQTKITFVTTGVLLRRCQTAGGSPQDVVNSLADLSHVIIDEVHERSLDTDFLLVLLRDVLKIRKDLKLILMSATLDADVFERYFSGDCSVGKVEIAGRTHPVQDIYREDILRILDASRSDSPDPDAEVGSDWEAQFDMSAHLLAPRQPKKNERQGYRIDYDFVVETVKHVDAELGEAEGGILIFLPGTMEIDQTLRRLRDLPKVHALPLHASLQSAEQRRVFARPPRGMRKVVAATNVAETSITIDDIVAVIDTGRVKETSFDPTSNMVRLTETWASRAACKQRRGRAGRVRAGKCYKLYTRFQESQMAERPEPEIRRVPLEQLCLSVKAMGVDDVPAFLASALTPPESLAVANALTMLRRIGALEKNSLTALGQHLSQIPADLRCGKLLVYGAAFGCLDACLTVAATLTVKSPFVSPQNKRDESKAARASFGGGHGDLVCDLRAFEEWSRRRSKGEPTSSLRRWCDENFLNHQTLMDIAATRSQYTTSLQEIGFLTPKPKIADSDNSHSANLALLRSLIAGAFQPQIARIDFPEARYKASSTGAVAVDPEAHTIKYFNEDNGRVFVHPGSTLFDAQGFPGNSVFMSYFTKLATSKVFIRDLTPFNVYGLLMFGGSIAIDPQGRGLLVDGWLRLRGWARIGVLANRLRMAVDALLAKKVDDPGLEISQVDVVKLVTRMVTFDGLDR